jgi:hypothetical protein
MTEKDLHSPALVAEHFDEVLMTAAIDAFRASVAAQEAGLLDESGTFLTWGMTWLDQAGGAA